MDAEGADLPPDDQAIEDADDPTERPSRSRKPIDQSANRAHDLDNTTRARQITVDAVSPANEPATVDERGQHDLLLLTIGQAARRLNIGRSKFYELIQSGDITTVHIDRSVRVATTDLIDYVERLRVRSAPPTRPLA